MVDVPHNILVKAFGKPECYFSNFSLILSVTQLFVFVETYRQPHSTLSREVKSEAFNKSYGIS